MKKNIFIKPTKYFGDVEVEVKEPDNKINGYASFLAEYNFEQNIFVSIYDYNIMGNKLPLCWNIVNKYTEINKIAKKAIIKNFSEENSIVKKYFEYFFEKEVRKREVINMFEVNNFEELDIRRLVKRLSYPDLTFYFVEDTIWQFSLDYAFLEYIYDDDARLFVAFNEELKLIDFEIQFKE